MQRKVRIGSRDSKLAVVQAELIKAAIESVSVKTGMKTEVEIITMKTTGDKILNKSLDKIGGKGLFVKELDVALLENRIDLAVHSLKDMPMEQHTLLPILGYSKREDPRDAILFDESGKAGKEDWIDITGIIGSSSKRRTIQLKHLFPKATFQGIRGNVQTRLRKLEDEDYSAIVLATAGLRRLGLHKRISRILSVEEVLPAAGQGILAVQGRKGEDYAYLEQIFCRESAVIAQAERSFVRTLDGGCSSPVAAFAEFAGNQIWLRGLYYEEESEQYEIASITGTPEEAEQLGEKLALQMKQKWR